MASKDLCRPQFQAIPSKIQVVRTIPADPPKQCTRGVWAGFEQLHRLPVLPRGRGGPLKTRPMLPETRDIAFDFGPEGSDMVIGAKGEEKIISGAEDRRQHGLDQRVIGIDQDVAGPEAIELEGEVDHLELRRPKERMAEPKATVGDFRGNEVAGAQREEAARLPAFLH